MTWLSSTITAMANFSTQYNYQCVAVALLIMSQSVCTDTAQNCRKGIQAEWVQGASTAAIFIGSIVGQLSLGFLGDLFSRNAALSWTMFIALTSTVITAAASIGSPESIYAVIITFRFVLGVGLGGVYPLSATKASEDSSASHDAEKHLNSTASSWAYFWQLPGFFVPWLVGYIFSYCPNLPTDTKWRLILGLGAVPSFLTIILLLIEETWKVKQQNEVYSSPQAITRHLVNIENSECSDSNSSNTNNNNTSAKKRRKTHHPKLTVGEIVEILSTDALIREKLFAAGMTWFLFDMTIYGISLLSGKIIQNILLQIDPTTESISDRVNIRFIAAHQMIASGLTIPISAIGVTFVTTVGLKRLQITGFLLVALCALVMAALYNTFSEQFPSALFALYCLLFVAVNFVLGSTTYSIPAVLFHKEMRATFDGIAAAMGKCGATVGTFTFYYIAQSNATYGYMIVILLCACFALVGAVITYSSIHTYDFYNTERSHHPELHQHDKQLQHIIEAYEQKEGHQE